MNASSNAAGGAPLSKEEINDLPMLAYEGEVMLVQTEGEMARALNFLKKETLLGFDTESRPSFKKGKSYPTSLIQLAGSELVVLIRLNLTPFCGALAGQLADPGIIRPGSPSVTTSAPPETARVHTRRACRPRRDGETARHQGAGLRTLAAQLMGCRISAAQCSNWAKRPRRSRSAMPPPMRG
ncbi:MAG: 3'-5' exonuclease domain-containing protein 2 [Bilophila wadsworthia]